MPKINWQQVGTDMEAAVKGVLGANWQTVSGAAAPQLQAMVGIGQSIEQSYAAKSITADEYQSLQSMAKNALKGILSSYAAVGIVVAEQAAAAAWTVVATALGTAAGIPFA